MPEQPPPLHPEKMEPGAGLAERVTLVPKGKLPEHVAPQLIPAGALVTVPPPLPAQLTVRLTGCKTNVAVTVVAADRETLHGPVPEQLPPLHPEKVEPVVATAESVTLLPPGKLLIQVEPQLIPAGALVTVPMPAPPSQYREAKDLRGGAACDIGIVGVAGLVEGPDAIAVGRGVGQVGIDVARDALARSWQSRRMAPRPDAPLDCEAKLIRRLLGPGQRELSGDRVGMPGGIRVKSVDDRIAGGGTPSLGGSRGDLLAERSSLTYANRIHLNRFSARCCLQRRCHGLLVLKDRKVRDVNSCVLERRPTRNTRLRGPLNSRILSTVRDREGRQLVRHLAIPEPVGAQVRSRGEHRFAAHRLVSRTRWISAGPSRRGIKMSTMSEVLGVSSQLVEGLDPVLVSARACRRL